MRNYIDLVGFNKKLERLLVSLGNKKKKDLKTLLSLVFNLKFLIFLKI